jgi:hypothetical protein
VQITNFRHERLKKTLSFRHFLELEHILRMAKARAGLILATRA